MSDKKFYRLTGMIFFTVLISLYSLKVLVITPIYNNLFLDIQTSASPIVPVLYYAGLLVEYAAVFIGIGGTLSAAMRRGAACGAVYALLSLFAYFYYIGISYYTFYSATTMDEATSAAVLYGIVFSFLSMLLKLAVTFVISLIYKLRMSESDSIGRFFGCSPVRTAAALSATFCFLLETAVEYTTATLPFFSEYGGSVTSSEKLSIVYSYVTIAALAAIGFVLILATDRLIRKARIKR